MLKVKNAAIAALLIMALFPRQPARAQVIQYTSQSEFFARATIASTELFNSYPNFTYFFTQSVSFDGVTYTTDQTSEGNGFPGNPLWTIETAIGGRGPGNDLGTNFIGTDTLTFGQSNSVTALGFDLYGGGSPRYLAVVTETNGATSNFILTVPSLTRYFGYTSSLGISKISIVNAQINGSQSHFTLDNVSRSNIRGADAVPEPSPVALLFGSIVAGVGLWLTCVRRLITSPNRK